MSKPSKWPLLWDQHPPRLIWVFAVPTKQQWVLKLHIRFKAKLWYERAYPDWSTRESYRYVGFFVLVWLVSNYFDHMLLSFSALGLDNMEKDASIKLCHAKIFCTHLKCIGTILNIGKGLELHHVIFNTRMLFFRFTCQTNLFDLMLTGCKL